MERREGSDSKNANLDNHFCAIFRLRILLWVGRFSQIWYWARILAKMSSYAFLKEFIKRKFQQKLNTNTSKRGNNGLWTDIRAISAYFQWKLKIKSGSLSYISTKCLYGLSLCKSRVSFQKDCDTFFFFLLNQNLTYIQFCKFEGLQAHLGHLEISFIELLSSRKSGNLISYLFLKLDVLSANDWICISTTSIMLFGPIEMQVVISKSENFLFKKVRKFHTNVTF